MTKWNARTGWLAAALAIVLGWSTPGIAGPRPKMDRELEKRAKLTAGDSRVIIETTDHGTADDAIKFIGGKAGRKLKTFPGQVAIVSNQAIEKLARHPHVKFVYEDRPTNAMLARVNLTTGAAVARLVTGFSGEGVGVAVIDSGITSWHDDMTDHGSGQRVAAFVDFVNGRTSAYDDYGHGTHVSGIVAGNGRDSWGVRAGIAPASQIVSLKVLNGTGVGYMSNIIAALDWAVAHKTDYNIRVINMSVGAAVRQSYTTDPLTLAAKSAVDAGIVVVAAAGNLGRNPSGQLQYGGITAPGNAPWVITVGASNTNGTIARHDDTVADFSSRGPSAIDYAAKPDLVAPGTGTVSLAARDSYLYINKSSALVSGIAGLGYKPYLTLTGSSMAAPVVSGTVALMVQANPALTPNMIKAILEYTAQWSPRSNALQEGAGFLDSYGAVRLAKFFAAAQPGQPLPRANSWSRHIIWGNHMVSGGVLLPEANAWPTSVVWGQMLSDGGDNIVWGTALTTDTADNIVWGTSALGADNIVWGTASDQADNIVWGTMFSDDNIVWGTDCGTADCSGVVWGATETLSSGDNIVWGTCTDTDNIVWGTSADDNIVWGTSLTDADNIVWGTSSDSDITFTTDGQIDPTVLPSEDLADQFFDSLFSPPPPSPPTEPDSGTTGTVGGGL